MVWRRFRNLDHRGKNGIPTPFEFAEGRCIEPSAGHCLYCNGIVFALVAHQAVNLKVDAANRQAFEARGLAPFRPFPDSEATMQYYLASAETFESLDGLREWGGGAVAAGQRSQAKRPQIGKKAVS